MGQTHSANTQANRIHQHNTESAFADTILNTHDGHVSPGSSLQRRMYRIHSKLRSLLSRHKRLNNSNGASQSMATISRRKWSKRFSIPSGKFRTLRVSRFLRGGRATNTTSTRTVNIDTEPTSPNPQNPVRLAGLDNNTALQTTEATTHLHRNLSAATAETVRDTQPFNTIAPVGPEQPESIPDTSALMAVETPSGSGTIRHDSSSNTERHTTGRVGELSGNQDAGAHATSEQARPRGLPPPGTLIVVQGIVQTSDNQRQSSAPSQIPMSSDLSSDNPRPDSRSSNPSQPRSYTANRRSRFLDPIRRLRDSEQGRSNDDSSSSERSGSTVLDSMDDNSTSFGSPDDIASTPSTPPSLGDATMLPTDTRAQTGSNSVDVLGALLSVATAATAANLLTASVPNDPGSSRSSPPMLSLTRALAAANPEAAAAIISRNRERNMEGRTQNRSVLENLRERLSPGRGSAFGNVPPSLSQDAPQEMAGGGTEALFSELARVFNLAVGQQDGPSGPTDLRHQNASSGSSTSNSSSTNTIGSNDDQMDGFEQFLIRLQQDLRSAFSQLSNGRSNSSSSAVPDDVTMGHHHGNETSYFDERSSQGTSSQSARADLAAGTHVTANTPRNDSSDDGGVSTNSIEHENLPTRALPRPSSSLPSIITDRNSSSSTSDSPSNQGNISWWRVHRFAPMRTRDSQRLSQQVSLGLESPTRNSNQLDLATGGTILPNDDDSVVPVIVVGLRSRGLIGPNTRQEIGRRSNNSAAPRSGVGSTPSTLNSQFRDDPSTNLDGPSALPPGLQTFFIYVFGGYYPPDHRIVNNPEHLESFESFDALWELMELLGTSRSTVASDDDIQQANLEVFKAKSMKEYERLGKMVSVGSENCPICLDDYEPEDDLRLLSCKHAFHRVCVDQWLKTGKNTCPACRTKGVPTSNVNPQSGLHTS